MVQKIEDMFIRYNRIHERNGLQNRRTDRHRMTARACNVAPLASTVR